MGLDLSFEGLRYKTFGAYFNNQRRKADNGIWDVGNNVPPGDTLYRVYYRVFNSINASPFSNLIQD